MIALEYDNDTMLSDLARDEGNLETDEGLETAVLISLFTRRRALEDDALPEPLSHREGWWGDTYSDVDDDLIGSRLWLLGRSKTTQATLNLAKVYAEEALEWMIEDGIAESITVTVERHSDGRLAFQVQILKPEKTASRWINTWAVHLAAL